MWNPAASVLLVEDHTLDVELAFLAFQECGLHDHLVVVEDGQEALDYLQYRASYSTRRNSMPGLILLDLNMRRMNGFQVLKAIRSDDDLKHLPTVIFTTSSSPVDRAKCFDLGADDYLQKPGSLDDFVQLVMRLAQRWLVC